MKIEPRWVVKDDDCLEDADVYGSLYDPIRILDVSESINRVLKETSERFQGILVGLRKLHGASGRVSEGFTGLND